MLLVRDLVREVVAEHAPHELPLVDGLRTLDDAEVVRVLRGRGPRREPLGFGFAEVAALVTPVVWLALDQVLKQTAETIAESALRRCRSGIRKLLRRQAEPPVSVVELTPEQLALVRTLVLERAAERGIAPQEAEALANDVVARIATGNATGHELSGTPESDA
ncbi:hypothetical protein GCM10009759_11790 [Kitasatospora saccharophila]|uniref:Uncharacterized protein n=1 Tax=Kitasatospora saccharophila TaxID=407973 RepID=A0ABN2WCF2_9ACTN